MSASLEDLVAEFVERRDAGESLTPEGFANAHAGVPGLLPALRAVCATDALLPERRAPESIGPYRVLAQLGGGGGGRVLKVVHKDQPAQPLALKLLPLVLRGLPRAVERFRREAAALSRVRHKGIVGVLDVSEHEGSPFLVMELVEGEALSARIERARQRLEANRGAARADLLDLSGDGDGVHRAAALVAELARSVQAAHAAGLVHRDLKPSNVILRAPDSQPVLIDFGLAGSDDGATLTATGDVLGTPSFMAPEQARGEAADARADVYGLGAVLYEMVTLHVPHTGAQVHDVIERVLRAPARPVRHLDASIPRALEHILRRAMAYRRERRYSTAADLAAALDAFASGRTAGRATLSVGARVEDFFLWHGRSVRRAAVGVVGLAGALAAFGLWQQSRARRAVAATLATASAHLADDAKVTEAAEQLRALDAASPLAHYVLSRRAGASRAGLDAHHVLLGEGEDLLAKKDAAAALVPLQRAVDARRDDPLAVGLLGIAAARARDWQRAERELTTAARLLPQCSRLPSELAWVHRRRDQFELAVQAMRDAVAIAPDNADHWHDLARMLAYAKRPEEGLVAVDRAIGLADKEKTVYLHTKGALLNGLDRHDAAILTLQEVVEQAPTVAHLSSLASAFDSAHRIMEARDTYQLVLAKDDKYLPTLLALAHLHAGERLDCDQCVAYFAAHKELLDAALVEDYALRGLAADRGQFNVTAIFAGYLVRMQRTERFLREIDELLRGEFDAIALGRLVQARRTLVE